MKITAIIPARGGSKRLLRKNIAKIWGIPMLCWSIKACKTSKYDIEVWVSTEDDEIKNIAKSSGANIHKRSPALSGDKVFKQEVIRSAARFIDDSTEKSDIYLSVQANSPQISSKVIDSVIDKLIETGCSEVFTVDRDLIQNAAIRAFKGDYVYQKDLSTYCAVVACDVEDVHTQEDLDRVEKNGR